MSCFLEHDQDSNVLHIAMNVSKLVFGRGKYLDRIVRYGNVKAELDQSKGV